jgi:hypothetical protein
VRSPGFPTIQVSRMAPSAALAVRRDAGSSTIPGIGLDNPANLTQAELQRAWSSATYSKTRDHRLARVLQLEDVSLSHVSPRGLQARLIVSYLLLLTQGMLLTCTTCTTSQMTDPVSTFAKTPLRCHSSCCSMTLLSNQKRLTVRLA